jgi:ABC-type antimicrobial peptide transport system permease subunit
MLTASSFKEKIIHPTKTNAVLRRKMFRQTLSGWKQFLAIIAIGGIAVTLFVGLLSNAKSLSDRVDLFYEQGNAADIYVTSNEYQTEDLQGIKGCLEDHDAVEARFEMGVRLGSANAYAAVAYQMPNISKPVSIEAASVDQTATHFFLIDDAYWTKKATAKDESALHLDVGDKASITYDLSSYLTDQEIAVLANYVKPGGTNILAAKTLTVHPVVTGIMTTSENVTKATYYASTFWMSKDIFRSSLMDVLSANYEDFAINAIKTNENIDWGDDSAIAEPSTFPQTNQYLIKLQAEGTKEKKETALKAYFDGKASAKQNLVGITDRSSNPWSIAVDTDVRESMQLTFVFPFVFFAVALLVILTTISQIILKERTQIGTMKALGLTKHQIYYHYISLTLTLVSIGTIIGCILGPIIIPYIMGQKYDILYTLPARPFFVFPWWQALLTAAVFLLSGALVTLLVCHKEISLTPAQSMRPALVSFRRHRDVVSAITKRPPGAAHLSIKMAFRNIRVNLVKSIMVVVGVMGCTALLVCGFGIEDTLNYGIQQDLGHYYDSDISLAYPSVSASHRSDFEQVAGVDMTTFEEYLATTSSLSKADRGNSVTTKTYSSMVRFFNDDSTHWKFGLTKGKVAISSKISEELSLSLGDTIDFSYNGATYSGEVGTIYSSFTVHGVNAFYSDYPDVEKAKVYNSAFVDVKEGSEVTTVEKAVTALPFVGHAESQEEMRSRIKNIMSGVYIMTNAVKVFAVLLAVTVLYNLALLNFRERIRDIATLKVLGFSRHEIALSLMFEIMTLTGVGVLIGLPLGFPFMELVLVVNKVNLVAFLYHIFWPTFLYAFLITFVVAFLVNLYLASLTGKVKMVESLKSVE